MGLMYCVARGGACLLQAPVCRQRACRITGYRRQLSLTDLTNVFVLTQGLALHRLLLCVVSCCAVLRFAVLCCAALSPALFVLCRLFTNMELTPWWDNPNPTSADGYISTDKPTTR